MSQSGGIAEAKAELLAGEAQQMYPPYMTLLRDIPDHVRLRERFFGATRAILARQ